jgi:transcriptional regulator with XRE-family HTH domain
MPGWGYTDLPSSPDFFHGAGGTVMSRELARRAVRREVALEGRLAFAKRAGVDPGTLANFLDGTRWPQSRTLSKIEAAIGWTPGYIFDLAEGSTTSEIQSDASSGARILVESYRQLSPEDQRRVERIVATFLVQEDQGTAGYST